MPATNWKEIIVEIMNAKPPRGKACYSYGMIRTKTGISESVLSRLVTGSRASVDYDSGLKLVAMHDDLIKKGKIQK